MLCHHRNQLGAVVVVLGLLSASLSGGQASPGALDLNVKPKDTQVYVNGHLVGSTGDFDGWPNYLWLYEGLHELIFYKHGFTTVIRDVAVKSNLVLNIKFRMKPGTSEKPQEITRYKSAQRASRYKADVTHGHYVGSILICDDGYKDVGGQCKRLPAVTYGHYVGSILICDDGYKDVGGQCSPLRPVHNAFYYGSVLICNKGYVFENGECVHYNRVSSVWQRVDQSALRQSQAASSADGPTELLGDYAARFSTDGGQYFGERSGTTHDRTSGNSYRWWKRQDGSTEVHGSNLRTGSLWRTTIKKDGSMDGWDKKMNYWRYDANTGFYVNFGTGKMCFGKGELRTCY